MFDHVGGVLSRLSKPDDVFGEGPDRHSGQKWRHETDGHGVGSARRAAFDADADRQRRARRQIADDGVAQLDTGHGDRNVGGPECNSAWTHRDVGGSADHRQHDARIIPEWLEEDLLCQRGGAPAEEESDQKWP